MKKTWFSLLALIGLLVVAVGCSNHASEKKIAALEARLAELEGKTTPTATASTAATPAETKPDPGTPLPVIKFSDMNYDFGTIKEGDVVDHTFEFTNTGDAPLIIQEAKPSCGCTVPDWSKEPVPVGGKGYIKASFNSNGHPNMQNKTITVTANTWPKQTTLMFKAMVTPKAQ